MKNLVLEPRLRCVLCSTSDYETAIPFPDIPVLRCRSCGFLYSGRVMPEKILTAYYANDFASPRHRRGQQLNAAINFRVLSKILDSPRKISVLDVGCGYGFLLRLLRDKWRADVTGIEISKREISHARDVLGLAAIHGSPAELPSNQLFDLVTCFEVIEHIRAPVLFVRQLLRRIAPGGLLVLLTDNFDSAAARSMGYAFPKWIPHSHISHFTPATLEKCLHLAGAKDVSFYSYTPWEMLALMAKNRLSASRPPSACFCLEEVVTTEMNRSFRLFGLRKVANKFWLAASLRQNSDGSLMVAVVHPDHPPP